MVIPIFWEVMLNGVVYNNSGFLEVDHQSPIRVFHEMDAHKKYHVGQLMIHITVVSCDLIIHLKLNMPIETIQTSLAMYSSSAGLVHHTSHILVGYLGSQGSNYEHQH